MFPIAEIVIIKQTGNSNLKGGNKNNGFNGTEDVSMDVCGRTHGIDSVDSGAVNSENLGITSVLNSEDNIIENNYTEEDCGAYTIAYRNIEFAVTENTNYTDERTEENDNIAVYKTDIPGALHAGLYNMGSDTGSSQLTGSSRPLVVVVVRGLVTNDIGI